MPAKKQHLPPAYEFRQFTREEIDRGIAQLRERIADVKGIDPAVAAVYTNNSAEIVASDVSNTILRIFGEHSPEYREHQHIHVWAGHMVLNMHPEQIRQGIADGTVAVVAVLQNLIRRLEADSKGETDPAARARRAFGELNLNHRIADVATELYLDGHYSQAVFEAAKALVNLVKERSGQHQLDGAGLMTTAFSASKPVLAFNDLKDQTDRDEQVGMMRLFEGAVLAIRNPGGHAFPDMTATRATQYIGLLSMLADQVREARRVATPTTP